MADRVIETSRFGQVELTFLCQHCGGININLAGTKFCGQCGKQVFVYTNGRQRA